MASAALSLSSSSSCLQNFNLRRNSNAGSGINASVFIVVAQKKAKKVHKIVLKEDVAELGKKGQLLDLKAGFCRNFLLPMGMAQIVTPDLIKLKKKLNSLLEFSRRLEA